ncbi:MULTISPECIES: hypothetical protein [Pseudofrankia]|uniref:hypothetical protein n=1 Tax=Pseudofrankia TaxID=2994363 RepID=UPI000234D3BC|nr:MULTISPECIES: hypothetical protein [Pseudofrankia]OHV34766.1 hypothetical protein BCD49_22700 [Pseudofrankia sp. EUN1h]
MSAENGSTSALSMPTPTHVLGSRYGRCGGRAAFARETSAGSWQVKVHDPTSPRVGHDGWLLIGSGWSTLAEALAATGLT